MKLKNTFADFNNFVHVMTIRNAHPSTAPTSDWKLWCFVFWSSEWLQSGEERQRRVIKLSGLIVPGFYNCRCALVCASSLAMTSWTITGVPVRCSSGLAFFWKKNINKNFTHKMSKWEGRIVFIRIVISLLFKISSQWIELGFSQWNFKRYSVDSNLYNKGELFRIVSRSWDPLAFLSFDFFLICNTAKRWAQWKTSRLGYSEGLWMNDQNNFGISYLFFYGDPLKGIYLGPFFHPFFSRWRFHSSICAIIIKGESFTQKG